MRVTKRVLLCLTTLLIPVSFGVAQEQPTQSKSTATITRNDGRVITGRITSQDAATITIETDGMVISLPTASVASVAYNTNVPGTAQSARARAAEEVVRALRKLVVANDTGVSLINFGPMLVQAKTDVVEPLREIGQDAEFARAANRSIEAYQHAFEAWQMKVRTEFVFASDDYGKWAIATYGVKKRGLLKTVYLDDVRQAALSRARNYFQQAESLALDMRKPLPPEAKMSGSGDSNPDRVSLAGRWIVEITAPDSGKRETFTLEIDPGATRGRAFAFHSASLIESITPDASDAHLFVITTAPEKINKKQGQVVIRVRFEAENRLTGTLQLRRLSDGYLTAEAPVSAIRARD